MWLTVNVEDAKLQFDCQGGEIDMQQLEDIYVTCRQFGQVRNAMKKRSVLELSEVDDNA